MAIEDLLQALLGGATGQGMGGQQQGDPLSGLLGSLLGGGALSQDDQDIPQQGLGSSDLLGALLGGEGLPQSGPQELGSSDLLGALLGGEALSSGGQAPQQGIGSSDLLGALLGGGQAQPGVGGLGSVLGGLLGGSAMGGNAVLAPISQALSERLGLSPAMAQAVVLFAVTTVIPALIRGMARKRGATLPAQSGRLSTAGGSDVDLDDLLQRMGEHQELGGDYLESTGLSQELAAQTGLDAETATRSLQQTMLMLGDYLDETPGAAAE